MAVTGVILQRKARDFACIMGYHIFVASSSWVQHFKERHDIAGRMLVGESLTIDEESATTRV